MARALAEFTGARAGGAGRARLVPCLPQWPLRGAVAPGGLSPEDAACCARWDPARATAGDGELGELGFFVALSERDQGGAE